MGTIPETVHQEFFIEVERPIPPSGRVKRLFAIAALSLSAAAGVYTVHEEHFSDNELTTQEATGALGAAVTSTALLRLGRQEPAQLLGSIDNRGEV